MFAWVKHRIGQLLRRLLGRPQRYRGKRVSDIPDRLESGVVYIVGEDGYDWSAVMKCPGGCGKMLEMNLLPDAAPVWRVTEHENGSISLRPSVGLKTGCRCHFVLERGLIRWA
jgi:Family of unknown function (DUF6527)